MQRHKLFNMFNSGKQKKVLYICWGRKGGIPRFALEFAENVPPQDSNSFFSLSKNSELFKETLPYTPYSFHIKTFHTKFELITSVFKLPILYLQLGKFIKKNRINTIFTFSSHYLLPFFVPLFRILNVKFVLLLHDPEFHLGEKNSILRMLQMLLIKNADHIVTLSQHTADITEQKLHIPKTHISVLFHPPLYLNHPHSSQTTSTCVQKLLFIGRLREYKNLESLLAVFKILRKKYPHLNLTIAGQGKISPELTERLSAEGILIINRWLRDDEFCQIVEAHDLVVLPYSEASQSGVISVAHGCNKPVVITPVGGLIEQVQNQKTGIIAKSPAPLDIASAIEIYLNNTKTYAKTLENITQYNHLHGWSTFYTGLQKVFQKVK